MKKLSKNMEIALSKCTDKWQSAYELQSSIGTLDALKNRGLVDVHYGAGSMAFPRVGIKYRLVKSDGIENPDPKTGV